MFCSTTNLRIRKASDQPESCTRAPEQKKNLWISSKTPTSSYPTTRNLNDVQQELVEQMVKDLTDQIFNATVANW